ncbi:MAG: hypothetical protein ACKO66_11100 [Flavobacteriales bacterium]
MSESKIIRAVQLKCPCCGEATMFENARTYTLDRMGNVLNHCSHCGANLKPETGFYFGAAYVNWALTVALWVSVLVALKVFDALGWIEFGFLTHPVKFLTTGMACTLILFPYIFRLSRALWAAMFVQADPSATAEN